MQPRARTREQKRDKVWGNYATPTLTGDGLLYFSLPNFPSQLQHVYRVQDDGTLKHLAEFDRPAGMASPYAVGSRLYLRTIRGVACLGKR